MQSFSVNPSKFAASWAHNDRCWEMGKSTNPRQLKTDVGCNSIIPTSNKTTTIWKKNHDKNLEEFWSSHSFWNNSTSRLVNSELYCEHLGRMYTFWRTKCSALINRMTALLLQDNAKSNASYMIRNKVEKNWRKWTFKLYQM